MMRVGRPQTEADAIATTHRAVVFDLDGTLVDTMDVIPRAYAETIRRLGGPTVTPREVITAWHIGAAPAVLAHFLGRQVTAEEQEGFYRRCALIAQDVRPFPGVRDLLDAVRAAGYLTAVFTAAARRMALPLLDGAGLATHFPTVVCGDDVEVPKPDPTGLHLTLSALTTAPSAATYVGDAATDLACAAAAGVCAIHARWSGTPALGHPLTARHPSDVLRLLRRTTVSGCEDEPLR